MFSCSSVFNRSLTKKRKRGKISDVFSRVGSLVIFSIVAVVVGLFTPGWLELLGTVRLVVAGFFLLILYVSLIYHNLYSCQNLLEKLIEMKKVKEMEPKTTEPPTTPLLTGRQMLEWLDDLKR